MFHLPSPETCQVWIWKQEKVKWMFAFSWFIVQQINSQSFTINVPHVLLLDPILEMSWNWSDSVHIPLPTEDTVTCVLVSDQWETRRLVSPVVSGDAGLWLVTGHQYSCTHWSHQTISFSLRQDEVMTFLDTVSHSHSLGKCLAVSTGLHCLSLGVKLATRMRPPCLLGGEIFRWKFHSTVDTLPCLCKTGNDHDLGIQF